MPSFHTTHRVRHSASEMFELVADIESYPRFVPLCRALRVRRRDENDGRLTLIADMEVGYKAIRETFTSRVTCERSQSINSSSNISTDRSSISKTAGSFTIATKAEPASSTSASPMNSRAARWVSSWAECSTRPFENSPKLSKIAPILSMARPPDVSRAIENSPCACASTRRFEEQLDRHGDRGGTHAVAAKVSETFFDADDGAASPCEAKMHEADGLSRRTPAGPRDAGDRKRHVRGRNAPARLPPWPVRPPR